MLLALLVRAGPLSPRELASLTGIDETEVSRRLRRLVEAGLARSEWARVGGATRRLYWAVSPRLCLELDTVSGAAGPRSVLASPPPPPRLYGRGPVLEELRAASGVVILHGVPGVGKTALASTLASTWSRGPVAWLSGPGASPRLLEAGERVAGARLPGPGGLVVVDEACRAPAALLEALAERGHGSSGLILLLAHAVPRRLARLFPHSRRILLRGIAARDAGRLLIDEGLGPGEAQALGEGLGGVPSLLHAAAHGGLREEAERLWRRITETAGCPAALLLARSWRSGAPVQTGSHEAIVLAESGLLTAEGRASPEASAVLRHVEPRCPAGERREEK